MGDPVPHPSRQPRRGPSLEPTNSLQPGLQARKAGPRADDLFHEPEHSPENRHTRRPLPGHRSDHAHRHRDALRDTSRLTGRLFSRLSVYGSSPPPGQDAGVPVAGVAGVFSLRGERSRTSFGIWPQFCGGSPGPAGSPSPPSSRPEKTQMELAWAGPWGALVAESVTPVKGVMTFGPTKGHERREVPMPRFLLDDLARHVAGKSPDDLVFAGAAGRCLRIRYVPAWRAEPSCEADRHSRLTPHELRHTAASLGDCLRRGYQGRAADARPQVGDDDARPVRAPVRRSARRCRRCNGRRAGQGAR